KKDSINGAFICPVIAIVQLPLEIEKVARKFFWFRTYKMNFYQVIRLIPSNIRLYFESSQVVATPNSFLNLFGITDEKSMEDFESIKFSTISALYRRNTRIVMSVMP
ncbi:MAG: hypothetical protein P8141_13310, partial [Gammaproteobacteria bacterium]